MWIQLMRQPIFTRLLYSQPLIDFASSPGCWPGKPKRALVVISHKLATNKPKIEHGQSFCDFRATIQESRLTYLYVLDYLLTYSFCYLKFQRKLHLLSGARYAGGIVSVPKVSSLWSSVKRQFMNMADRRTDRQTNTMPQQMSGKKLKLITTE